MTWKLDLTKNWLGKPEVQGQAVHALIGLSVVLVTALFGGMLGCYIALGGVILFAALKEFWIDAVYEIPIQTWQDNLLDFGMYTAGGVLGLVLCILRVYAMGRVL